MKKLSSISAAAAIVSASLLATPAFAASEKSLQLQIDALTQRLSEMEQRLDELEKKPTTTINKTTVIRTESSKPVPTNPGEWRDTTNWIHLKVGYNYDEVRELLGTPLKIRRGSSEYWYYTDRKLDGPHVKFLFKKVNSWKPPEGTPKSDD